MRIEYKKNKIQNDKNINIKIVHISDIHFAHNYKTKRLKMISNKIKKINPNYICITGDLIDLYDVTNDTNFVELKNWLKELSQICKIIISIGNHEYIKMTEKGFGKTENIEWLKRLKSKKIIILDNEIYEENDISFIGYNPDYDYYYKQKEKTPEKYNKKVTELIQNTKTKYKILLLHTPIFLFKNNNYKNIDCFDKINLTLCGHTHGGMIPSFIPGHFGIISPTRELFPKNIRGKIKLKNNTVIISSGIMKLSRKSKLTYLNDIYGSNINEINIQYKIINKK